jgi:hypothetical protein
MCVLSWVLLLKLNRLSPPLAGASTMAMAMKYLPLMWFSQFLEALATILIGHRGIALNGSTTMAIRLTATLFYSRGR